ncbi:MAG: phospholipase D family protein [bacterium]
MLKPDERALYLDILKPPTAYELEYALAATYSLNLTTLIMLPLALSKYRYNFENEENIDQIELLEALENSYDKLDVFCQKGQIKIPNNINILYSFLEETVIEAQIDQGKKAFHPKFWLLKFKNDKSNYRYRLIVSSRNISFDKSWDTVLVLEGEKSDRKTAVNQNLADFIQFLPQTAAEKLSETRAERIAKLAAEIKKVEFKAVDNFSKKIKFFAPGAGAENYWPFDFEYQRALIISPFISPALLQRFKGSNNILVSRQNELDQIYPSIKDKFNEIYLIDDLLDYLSTDSHEQDSAFDLRNGLHAKIFIFENQNDNSLRIYTGSANATNAAFNGNLELMAALKMKNTKIRIDDLITKNEEGNEINFGSILTPYIYSEAEADEEDELEAELKNLKRDFLQLDIYLKAETIKTDSKKLYNLKLRSKAAELDQLQLAENKKFEISCWPATLKKEIYAQSLNKLQAEGEILFSNLTINSFTTFIAFEIKIENKKSLSFVLNLSLENEPKKRKERILTSIISDQNKFIKFLYLLLQDKDQLFLSGRSRLFKSKTADKNSKNKLGLPLMEDLLQSLTDNPYLIDRIQRIVDDLEAAEEKRIPAEFYDIWEAIIEVRSEEIEGF